MGRERQETKENTKQFYRDCPSPSARSPTERIKSRESERKTESRGVFPPAFTNIHTAVLVNAAYARRGSFAQFGTRPFSAENSIQPSFQKAIVKQNGDRGSAASRRPSRSDAAGPIGRMSVFHSPPSFRLIYSRCFLSSGQLSRFSSLRGELARNTSVLRSPRSSGHG